jgi:hypothetical protein
MDLKAGPTRGSIEAMIRRFGFIPIKSTKTLCYFSVLKMKKKKKKDEWWGGNSSLTE